MAVDTETMKMIHRAAIGLDVGAGLATTGESIVALEVFPGQSGGAVQLVNQQTAAVREVAGIVGGVPRTLLGINDGTALIHDMQRGIIGVPLDGQDAETVLFDFGPAELAATTGTVAWFVDAGSDVWMMTNGRRELALDLAAGTRVSAITADDGGAFLSTGVRLIAIGNDEEQPDPVDGFINAVSVSICGARIVVTDVERAVVSVFSRSLELEQEVEIRGGQPRGALCDHGRMLLVGEDGSLGFLPLLD